MSSVTSPDSSSGLSIAVADSSPSPTAGLAREKGSLIAADSNIVAFWVRHRLFSADRVERHYAFLLSMLLASTLLFSLLKTDGPLWLWGSPMCSLWATGLIVTTLGNVWAEQRERWGLFEVTRGIQFLLAMLSVLIYYDGSNVINRYRYAVRGDAMLYDESLLRMDEFIWGWLWPRGQMALWLDTQLDFGVTTHIGRLYAELFQILYVSYYFWGNFIGIVLAVKYFKCVWNRSKKGMGTRSQWRVIQMFVSSWVGAFVFNHLINLCFPAVSPRIYLKDAYKNELKGVWLLAGMRNAITNAAANTFSAFPSGHCGLSILAVLLAWRLQNNLWRIYTGLVVASTVLIVLATQVLRYHYFVDFAFSGIVVAFGAWLGGFHSPLVFEQSRIQMGTEEHDDEGKPVGSPISYEQVGLLSREGGSAAGGQPSSSPRNTTGAAGNGGGGGDLELGRVLNPPLVLSAGVFGGSMTRSLSSQKIDKSAAASKADEAV